ncbi:MAG: prepilin-type N-terminal cleavage/methylation domain-containing protein [Phycisphaerales bacterium]|jgi:prepilin-type N-terminal cleavage/methylation domain-containing protein|nr:prepilin-type N-terminal cleavage/methylation domain-containing protein [Phycisphaerales bacterium]
MRGTNSILSTDRRGVRRAFSLIEVLIAVVVLALALLGLAAVFPVVINEQKVATQTTLGVMASSSTENFLTRVEALNQEPIYQVSGVLTNRRPSDGGLITNVSHLGWRLWRDNLSSGNSGFSPTGAWVVPGSSNSFPVRADVATGLPTTLTVANPGAPSQTAIDIPLASRLFPPAYGETGEPRFVSDFAARRILADRNIRNPKPSKQDQIELAIFVRPIDPTIRVPREKRKSSWESNITLSDLLVARFGLPGSVAPAWPVGYDSSKDRLTRNGTGDAYAPLMVLKLRSADPKRPDLVRVEGNADQIGFLTVFGQRLVDSTGVVRQVVEVLEDDVVRVEPALSRAGGSGAKSQDVAIQLAQRGALEAVFAPEGASDARVVRIEIPED